MENGCGPWRLVCSVAVLFILLCAEESRPQVQEQELIAIGPELLLLSGVNLEAASIPGSFGALQDSRSVVVALQDGRLLLVWLEGPTGFDAEDPEQVFVRAQIVGADYKSRSGVLQVGACLAGGDEPTHSCHLHDVLLGPNQEVRVHWSDAMFAFGIDQGLGRLTTVSVAGTEPVVVKTLDVFDVLTPARSSLVVRQDGGFLHVFGTLGVFDDTCEDDGETVVGRSVTEELVDDPGEFGVDVPESDGQGVLNHSVGPSASEGNSSGEHLVVWQQGPSFCAPGAFDARARLVRQDGVLLGSEIDLGTFLAGSQENVRVAADVSGVLTLYLAVWESTTSSGTDQIGKSIQARIVEGGAPVGLQFQVNDFAAGDQESPAVVGLDDGSFVVAWVSDGSPGTDADSGSVQLRRVLSEGGFADPQFQVNTTTTGHQADVRLEGLTDGTLLVYWESGASELRAQRLALGIFGDGFETGTVETWGNSTL